MLNPNVEDLLEAGWVAAEEFDSHILCAPDFSLAAPFYFIESLCYEKYREAQAITRSMESERDLEWLVGFLHKPFCTKSYYKPFLAMSIVEIHKINPYLI